MKNTFYRILGVATAVLTVSACQLDLFPYDSIVYDETQPTIQKASDLASFEQGIHTYFRGRHQGTFYYIGDLMADGFNAVADFGNNFGPLHRTDSDFNAGDSDVEGVWGSYYSGINQYNLDIAAANNIADPKLKEQAQTFKGYAFFYRAYTYLALARHFGKAYNPSTAATDLSVPLVLVYDQNARPARDTQETVYKQIKADLDSAAFFLAEIPGKVRAQKPTIDAVNALYARYYLDVQDYDKAAQYANDLIASGTYALATKASEFTAEYVNDNGTEPIMQMFASLNEAPASLVNYTRLTQTGSEYVYTPYFLPSGKLIDAYDENDLRLAYWFKDAGEASYPIYVSGSAHNNPDVKVFTKFEGNPTYNNVGVPQGQQAIKPFRIGEMYLIAAEALYAGGHTTDALSVLQTLQTARGAELTQNITPEAIQNEWFKETVGEGQRTWCLKRWGVGFSARYFQPAASDEHLLATGSNYADKTMAAGDYHLTLPIPNYEMQINKNLVQNEGYGLLEN